MPSAFLRTFYLIGCLSLLNPGLMAQLPRLALPTGHAAYSKIVGVSSDDRILITSTYDHTFLWDLETGVQLKNYATAYNSSISYMTKSTGSIEDDVLQLHFREEERKSKLIYLKNGKEVESNYGSKGWDLVVKNSKSNRIVEVSKDYKTVILLSTVAPLVMKVLPGHKSVIVRVSFSNDGTRIFTESLTEILIWNSENGDLISRLEIGEFTKVAGYNSDITKIITSEPPKDRNRNYNWTYKIWDTAARSILKFWDAYAIDISKDRTIAATLLNGEQISIRLLSSGEIINSFNVDKDTRKILLSHDAKKIFTATTNKIKCWQIDNGALLSTIDLSITDMILNNIGDNLIFINNYRQVTQIFNLDKNRITREFTYKLNQNAILSYFDNSEYSEIIVSAFSSIKLLNISKDQMKFNINNFGNTLFHKISPQQKWLATYGIGSCKIWNLKTNELHQDHAKYPYNADVSFSVDDKLFAIQSKTDSAIIVFDVFSKRAIKKIKIPFRYVASLLFDASSTKLLVTDGENKYIQVFNLLTDGLLFSHEYNKTDGLALSWSKFSSDGKHLFIPLDKNRIGVYSFESNEIKSYFNDGGSLHEVSLASDGSAAILVSRDTIKILSLDSWNITEKIGDKYTYLAKFWPDSRKIITASYSNIISIWNLKPKQLIKKFKIDSNFQVNDVDFKNNELMATLNGETVFFDLSTGKKKFSLYEMGKDMRADTHVIVDTTGYYKCAPNLARLLYYVTEDLKVISFDQLDVKYNRPDRVMQALGGRDSTLIKSYKLAYQKRIEKLGIDTTAFDGTYNVPEADFVDRGTIKTFQVQEEIKLRIKGNDQARKLDQFNVWVNQVPVYGLKGVSLRGRNSKELDTTIVIQLSAGENRIETSIRNDNGIESYRKPLTVAYDPAVKPKEKIYFVGIGIGKFSDQSKNLMYSAKDIIVLAEKMKKKYGNNIVIDTLLNTSVTVENVKALKAKLLKTTVNDKVIVAYSGHGLLSNDNDYYLSTYSVNFDEPENGGLPYDELENILDGIPARKKLLLLDACHSGEVDNEASGNENQPIIVPAKPSRTQPIPKGGDGRKGARVQSNPNKGKIGLANSFDLMQTLFVNVGKNTGTTVFAAAAGSQAAYEKNDLQHSVFSYFIIKAFDQNAKSLKLSELKKSITENVEKESNQKQTPTFRSETIAYDWDLW